MAVHAEDLVCDVIQRVYGHSTRSRRARKAAQDTLRALYDAGWCPPDVLAGIVESAGGDVLVQLRSVIDPPALERVEHDAAPYAFRLTTSRRHGRIAVRDVAVPATMDVLLADASLN